MIMAQSVKSMPRQQQKAVFASMGKGSNSVGRSTNREKLMSESLNNKYSARIERKDIRYDNYSQKYYVKPSGNFTWSENIVVNPKASKQDWVKRGAWTRSQTFVDKITPSIFKIRLLTKKDKERYELEKLVNKHGIEEGYNLYQQKYKK